MKKIIVFSLLLVATLVASNFATAQNVLYKVANSKHVGNDTLTNTDTGIYSKVIPGLYFGATQLTYTHLSGSADTCNCTLQESVNGITWNTTTNVFLINNGSTSTAYQSPSIIFNAAGSNGLDKQWNFGDAPLTKQYYRWYCLHKNTSRGILKVWWQIKR